MVECVPFDLGFPCIVIFIVIIFIFIIFIIIVMSILLQFARGSFSLSFHYSLTA